MAAEAVELLSSFEKGAVVEVLKGCDLAQQWFCNIHDEEAMFFEAATAAEIYLFIYI